MRVWFLLAVSVITVGCDPAKYAAIQVAPETSQGDRAALRAVGLVSRLAARRGFAPAGVTDAKGGNDQGWMLCFSKSSAWLCGKIKDREAQFEMRQYLTSRFSPSADSLWRDIADSLRVHFGEQRVRECRWQAAPDPVAAGCPSLSVPHALPP